MAKKNLETEDPAPDKRTPGELVSEAPTGEVPDLIALEPELPAESDTALVEAFAPAGVGDDVYVILPEGEASDIPVVETQVLEGVDAAAETAPLDDDPSVSKIAVLDSNPALDDTRSTGAVGEEQETQTLDDLATEIDEEVLATEGASADLGDTSIAGVAAEEVDGLGDESSGPRPLAQGGETPFARSRSWLKVALPAAAAILLSAGGYFYFFGGSQEGAGLHPGGVGAVASAGGASTAGAGVQGSSTASATTTEGGASSVSRPGESLVAAKEAFREKVLLALELGFGGEAKNE